MRISTADATASIKLREGWFPMGPIVAAFDDGDYLYIPLIIDAQDLNAKEITELKRLVGVCAARRLEQLSEEECERVYHRYEQFRFWIIVKDGEIRAEIEFPDDDEVYDGELQIELTKKERSLILDNIAQEWYDNNK